jgi:hypothetical protein
MSNQRKAEFVGDIFCMRCFWGGHGEISPRNLFYTGMYDLLEMLFQHPVEFPTAVARKSLTGWSHLINHQKAERFVFQNGIRDFCSFSQSKSGN